MASLGRTHRRRRCQRGITLFESLVSVIVVAASTVAIGQLQGQLRLAGDVARERSEALRVGQAAMEDLRAFAVVAAASAPRSYEAIAAATTTIAAASSAGHTSYRVELRVDDGAAAGAKATSVRVGWNDRGGSAREVMLHSFVAGAAPAYGGALGLDVGAIPSATRGVLGRAPTIQVTAHDLGNGRSAWKPIEQSSVALVLDNRSGDVVGRCDGIAAGTHTRDLSAADVAACASGHWLLIAGTVRFDGLPAPVALPLAAVTIALGAGSYSAAPSCFSEAKKTVRYVADGSLHLDAVAADATPAAAGVAAWDETGERFIAWHCVVTPRADGRWSGRATVVASGWNIGTGGGDRRVCRYAGSADEIDANIAHPGEYADVDRALVAQNFLIVPGGESCPRDPPTEQHQP